MAPAPNVASSVPQTLPTDIPRPPTPPRDKSVIQNHTKSAEQSFPNLIKSRTSSILTPDSSAESPNRDSINNTLRKKVNWPDHNQTISSPVVEPSPVSGEPKPIKSILKPYNGNSNSWNPNTTSKLSPPHAYPNLAAMLESIAQQLAGDDRNSKLDAYTTLSGTIAASDNVPELRVLKEKMPTLLQFMKRDMTARTTTGSWDTSLIVNDLVLVSAFLSKSAIAEVLTSDFCAFVVEFAAKTFEDPGLSKDVVKRLLHILAKQNFSPKVLSIGRVGKLITALSNVENLVKGKSITTGQLDVYRNLLRTSRSHMIVNTAWVEVLLNALLSTLKETRALAINLGFEAALVLGTESKVSRAVVEVLQRSTDEGAGPPYGEYFAKRMKETVSKRLEGSSAHIPRIWSVPVLFLRSHRLQFEQWLLMNTWLQVIGECFNSSDIQTKTEANIAWNRLIFAIRPDENTSPKVVALLRRPFLEQLKRKNKNVNASKSRKVTMSSICFLLYYSLRPDATPGQLDLYWDEYVSQIIGKALTPTDITESPELARRDLMDACHILKALFDSTTPRPWKETRAMDLGLPVVEMQPRELPALDSKWLRKNAPRVFPLLLPIFEKLYWDLNDEAALLAVLWKTYITSIASPAVKEVKVSIETMGCVACVFDFIYRIWQAGPNNLRSMPAANGQAGHDFLGSFGAFILPVIDGLGLLPFTEKQISMGTQDTFIVIATPSQKPRNSRGEALCPLHHLFILLTNECPGLQYDWKFTQLVRQILTPFFEARMTSKHQMDLIRDLLRLIPKESTEPSRLVWQVLAEFATTAADTRDGNGGGNSVNVNESLGVEYRNSLKLLELGLELSPHEPLPGWKSFFEAMVTSSTIDAGDGGRAIAVIEPLARAFTTLMSTNAVPGISYCRMLVSKATYPKDRLGFDAARRKLGGPANSSHKVASGTFDPYKQLYEYIRLCLENAYSLLIKDRPLNCADLLSAVTALLTRCPNSALGNVLLSLQRGFACWILDEHSKLSGGNPLSQAVTSLWARVCSHLTSLVKSTSNYTKLLNDYEILLCSGLGSKHRTIVNSTVRLWNSTFGSCEETFEYPVKVREALCRLQNIADLHMPFFPYSVEDGGDSIDGRQAPDFVENEDDISENIETKNLSAVLRRTPYLHQARSIHRKFTPQVLIGPGRSISSKRLREETPESGNRKSKKRISTPKLRHDDSQIQFEAIESSPIASTALNSQLLTDRQKEVKERQQAEAAMFPDIRSSPRPREGIHQRRSSTDLQLHRSASKAMLVSNRSERQTTPNFAPHVDYDAYVNSSPTPTQSLQVDEDLPGPSLSPFEDPERHNNQSYIEECDIPSSPPEMHDEYDHENMASVDPSAQIDPLAAENDRTVSTFEYTPLEKAHSSPSGLNTVPQTLRTDEHVSPAPTTPIKGNTPEAQHTPRTPVFHDALERHVSSDEISSDDVVFQDSISSPAIQTDPLKKSSPLSDLDESSMIRLMTEIDAVSEPRREHTPADEGTGQISLNVKSPPHRFLRKSAIPRHQPGANSRKSPELKPEAPWEVNKASMINDTHNYSSVPSLIPETPGTKVPLVKQERGFDPEQTIVVEIPGQFHEILNRHLVLPSAGPIIPRRVSTYTPNKRASPKKKTSPYKRMSTSESNLPSPSAAKRKRQELANETLDSQELRAQLMAPPRKRRGRPRKSGSITPSQSETSSQLRGSPGFSSIDLDAPNKTGEISFVESTERFSQGGIGEIVPPLRSVKGQREIPEFVVEGVMAEQNPAQGTSSGAGENLDLMESDIVAETTIGSGKSNSATSKMEVVVETRGDQQSFAKDLKSGMLSFESPATDAAAQTEMAGISTQSMREKLQSLIGDMSNAALSREEVNAFEDMLMDAKEQLYGAARRGRAPIS